MTTDATPIEQGFDDWAILELMGRRVLAGRLTEHEIAGAKFLRLDIPGGPTKFLGAAAVYAITPTDEDTARKVAQRISDPAPVQPWQLALTARAEGPDDDQDDDYGVEQF